MEESNVVAYVAGYIVKKLKGKICDSCIDRITIQDHDTISTDETLSFIRKKQFESAKEGLVYPSLEPLSVLNEMESEYRRIIEQAIYGDNINATLVASLDKVNSLYLNISDQIWFYRERETYIYIYIYICIYIYIYIYISS